MPDEFKAPVENRPDDGLVKSFGSTGKRYKSGQKTQDWLNENPVQTIGWQPTCGCEGARRVEKCRVLDPFMGSGTTALVARQNHCTAVGVELNPEYIAIAQRRLRQDVLF